MNRLLYLPIAMLAFAIGSGLGCTCARHDATATTLAAGGAGGAPAHEDDGALLCPEEPGRIVWSTDEDPYSWADTEARYPEAQ